jgi:hypothetical protein
MHGTRGGRRVEAVPIWIFGMTTVAGANGTLELRSRLLP